MRLACIALAISCATTPRPFPLRAPMLVDTDTRPVSVACRPEPAGVRCAPAEVSSPYVWSFIDSVSFAPASRVLSFEMKGEAANATSLDEVADSAWFQNRIGVMPLGACKPEELLPVDVDDGAWVVDQLDDKKPREFRVAVPGKGLYVLKADEPGTAERASAAGVIGAAFYNAVGFNTSCEQIVLVRRSQFAIKPGLTMLNSAGKRKPFDAPALSAMLASSTQVSELTRMQATKSLPGLPLGPFTYDGVRADDPNDVIAHERRRELRGSRLLAAWLNHWDARDLNTMDVWLATDATRERSSPGYVRHYVIDTRDVLGGHTEVPELTPRLGYEPIVSVPGIFLDFFTAGMIERPWDRARKTPGRDKFGLFSERDFDPAKWRGTYPNPAMLRMTERDGAWMARIIARFTVADVRAIVATGQFSDPADVEHIVRVLMLRQQRILARYLTRLSPIADVHAVAAGQICALDLARSSGVLPVGRFRYKVVQRAAGRTIQLATTTTNAGNVCFQPRSVAPHDAADNAPTRIAVFELDNGTGAGPLEIHTYDLGVRGYVIVGLIRPSP